MVVFVVYVHQDIQELAVKFAMHVKVIHAWMEEHANLSMEILVIFASVLVVLVVHDAKIVRILHVLDIRW